MYDSIAHDWKRKRNRPWIPFVEYTKKWLELWTKKKSQTEDSIKVGQVFLDLGSGSGRNAPFFEEYARDVLQVDESLQMLYQNQAKQPKIQATMEYLPFRNNSIDGTFAVASIHHVSSKLRREHVIQGIQNVTKNEGFIAITVWRFNQKKFAEEFEKQTNGILVEGKEYGDVEVPWTLSNQKEKKTFVRFYHLFMEKEFKELMSHFKQFFIGEMPSRLNKSNIVETTVEKQNFIFLGKIQL